MKAYIGIDLGANGIADAINIARYARIYDGEK